MAKHIEPREFPVEQSYRPRYDGIDAVDAIENGRTEYDGDDFTDSLDYSAELESVIERKDAATVLNRLMNALNASFPGDLVVMQRDDTDVYAPWTALRLQSLLGICDSFARQLYRSYEEGPGKLKESGLIPQRDKAFERAKRLYGSRNPERLSFALDRIRQLDEQINTLEEMLNACASVYDKAAAKADSRSQLPEWLPMEYEAPHHRRAAWAKQNAASPMNPIEYELMVRVEGKEAADAELARRQTEWATLMGAKTL